VDRRWADIKNVINHKRDFTIETIDSEKVEFQFSDVESAKNAWRFCVLQHTFYRQYEMNNDQTDKSPAPPVFQQAQIEVSMGILCVYLILIMKMCQELCCSSYLLRYEL
jgi:hypothetical protein